MHRPLSSFPRGSHNFREVDDIIDEVHCAAHSAGEQLHNDLRGSTVRKSGRPLHPQTTLRADSELTPREWPYRIPSFRSLAFMLLACLLCFIQLFGYAANTSAVELPWQKLPVLPPPLVNKWFDSDINWQARGEAHFASVGLERKPQCPLTFCNLEQGQSLIRQGRTLIVYDEDFDKHVGNTNIYQISWNLMSSGFHLGHGHVHGERFQRESTVRHMTDDMNFMASRVELNASRATTKADNKPTKPGTSKLWHTW